MTNCNILIDKGVNGNYISHRLAKNLPTYQLQDSYQYTNFNGKTYEIKETMKHYFFNTGLNILLGNNFLQLFYKVVF